jgi:hypothetical protein
MLTEWEKWKQSLGETRPWHLLDPSAKLNDVEKIKERLDICQVCPKFIKLTSQCKECGCIMKLKTQLINATCPLNKW